MVRTLVVRSGVAVTACLAVALVGFAACNSGGAPAPQAPAPVAPPYMATPYAAPTPAPTPGNPAVASQVQHGASVYASSCARCHGSQGQGGTGPALIGPGALPTNPPAGRQMRTGAFRSAMDIGMFIKNSMPPGGPATPPSDVAAVLAFVLQSNGVTPPRRSTRPRPARSPGTADPRVARRRPVRRRPARVAHPPPSSACRHRAARRRFVSAERRLLRTGPGGFPRTPRTPPPGPRGVWGAGVSPRPYPGALPCACPNCPILGMIWPHAEPPSAEEVRLLLTPHASPAPREATRRDGVNGTCRGGRPRATRSSSRSSR